VPLLRAGRPRLSTRLRTLAAVGVTTAVVATAAAVVTTADASADPAAAAATARDFAPAARSTADNPLAGRKLAVYKGDGELAWPPYRAARGKQKKLLGRIALTPKAKWFGSFIPDNKIARSVERYIADSQKGDPEKLVQMTFFRMVPWEAAFKKRDVNAREAASYKRWMNAAASAIGDAHVALVLQPDGPISLFQNPARSRAASLLAYSARVLSAQPNTSVYIEVGAADWPYGRSGVKNVMRFLLHSGIEYARGIALNGTHFTATPKDVQRAASVIQALGKRGITGKGAVINTSNSGHPWEFGDYKGPRIADDAPACRTAHEPKRKTCVMLGIPPTTDVARAAGGFSARTKALAEKYVDAYLWFGRPWLNYQAAPFDKRQALTLARTWKYAKAAGF